MKDFFVNLLKFPLVSATIEKEFMVSVGACRPWKSAAKAYANADSGRVPVLFHEYFLSKGVFMRNEQRRTNPAERNFQVF